MGMLDPESWRGMFAPQYGKTGVDSYRLEGSEDFLHIPLGVDGFSVYRVQIVVKNTDGNGWLSFDIHVDGACEFPPSVLSFPEDSCAWQVFDVDVPTARCRKNTSGLLRIQRSPHGSGTVLIRSVEVTKLPPGVGPNPEPRLRHQHLDLPQGPDENELQEINWYTLVMEAGMDELDQQAWRGKSVVAKKDERGAKCQSMEGERSIIFVPVKVEPNMSYRVHLDLKRESGNGKLFCNFYANRSFDFPHVNMVCENASWGTFDLQLKTDQFPANLPVVLRLWRSPGGTGSLLVKRIALEKLPTGAPAEEPKMIASSAVERMVAVQTEAANATAAPEPELEPTKVRRIRHANRRKSVGPVVRSGTPPRQIPNPLPSQPAGKLAYSCFDRPLTRVFFASETNDEAAMRVAFEANGLNCEAMPLAAGDAPHLPDLVRNRGGNWIHLHLRRGTAVTAAVIDQIRSVRSDIVITVWVEQGWPVFDANLLSVLRRADLALVGSDMELATYRSAGCFNAELWDPGAIALASAENGTGRDVVVLAGNPHDDMAESCAKALGAEIVAMGAINAGFRDMLAAVRLAVFADQWPSPVLFGLLSAGIPVLARGAPGIMEWCEDGKGLRFFSTPEECAAIATQLRGDREAAKALGEKGIPVGIAHSAAERVRELAARLGFFEVVTRNLPKDRLSYEFKRIMCVMRAVPASLLPCAEDGDISFMAASFTECRDLAAKVARFDPDLLHIHLDVEDDGLPWRDLLLDLRRRVPTMLVTAWHPGGQTIDRRVMDMRFAVDHLLVDGTGSLPPYLAESLVGTWVWNPGARPSTDPTAFRSALLAFARGMDGRRTEFLRAVDGGKVDLTVFIGTYNRLDQLRRAVETALASAANRTVEVVVNDAGSTDGTQEWLRRMADADRRVVPIFSGRRTSFTQAFNESLQIAKGKYICWLSDDIVSEGHALRDMCTIMDELDPMDMGGFCVRNSWSPEYSVRKDSGIHFPTVGCMYTETLRKMNGINMDYPYYSQDTDLDMRVLRLGGRVVACDSCRLLHDCRNDKLRVSNSNNHVNMMGDAKYSLAAWRPRETSRFPYPRILLVPTGGCGPAEILRMAASIKAQYSHSHVFVAGEASEQLDTRGPNSFLHKVPYAGNQSFPSFDVVVEVGPNTSVLAKPSDRAQTAFAKRILQR